MTAAADTEVGITDINVAITTTDGASNLGTTPLTVSTNKLTVVQAASVVIDTIRLSSTVSVNADSTSSNLHFVLNTAPDGGNVTLNPLDQIGLLSTQRRWMSLMVIRCPQISQ